MRHLFLLFLLTIANNSTARKDNYKENVFVSFSLEWLSDDKK